MKNRGLTLIAIAMFLYGFFVLILPQINFAIERQQGIPVNANYWRSSSPVKPLPMILGTPVQLDLDRLNIHLPVTAGDYNIANKSWLLDRIHAFYLKPGQFPLSSSAQPLIYAHEIKGVFINLNGVSLNEPLVITNSAGNKLYFKYVGDDIIYPNQVSQINKVPADRGVTLLTCTNPFFTQRRLYYFSYVGTNITTHLAMSN